MIQLISFRPFLMPHSLMTSSSSSFLWQHSCKTRKTTYLLQAASKVHQPQQEAPSTLYSPGLARLCPPALQKELLQWLLGTVTFVCRGCVCCSEKRCWHFKKKTHTTNPQKPKKETPKPKQLTFLHKLLPLSAAL